MKLKISGDTVIRLLTKRFKQQDEIKCGSIIGVDETTHTPVAILEILPDAMLPTDIDKNVDVGVKPDDPDTGKKTLCVVDN
ncbi:hypothetical protein [Chryseobacterium sp.]|uniref:hypothetical protein n=1 Tax=Chryseobacterium sp. TaxID=1871047 RepID=UPI002FCCB1CB